MCAMAELLILHPAPALGAANMRAGENTEVVEVMEASMRAVEEVEEAMEVAIEVAAMIEWWRKTRNCERPRRREKSQSFQPTLHSTFVDSSVIVLLRRDGSMLKVSIEKER